jgi:hypothetical protein
MTGSHVTDRCFNHLRLIPTLERIDVHYTNLSEEAIDKFRHQMPQCEVNKVESVPLPRVAGRVPNPPRGLQDLNNILAPGQEIIEIFIDADNNLNHRIHIHLPEPDAGV